MERDALLGALGQYARSTRATAALEFAFAFPALLVLMMTGAQVVTYVNAVRKVELIATSISEMISQAAPPPSNPTATTTTVSSLDIHFSFSSALVIFPYLMPDAARQGIAWNQDISVDYASVQFTAIPNTTCSPTGDQSTCYVANVVWTSTGTNASNARACVVPQLVMNDTASPNKLALPRSIFGPGSVIVIDIVYTFHPTFASRVLPALTIARSVYVKPRYVNLITYDTVNNNDGIATECPGY